MTRRSLFSLLASAAALLLPKWTKAESMPVLWGDGVKDDTPALQRLFDGGRVFCNRTKTVIDSRDGENPVNIVGARFKTTSSISVKEDGGGHVMIHDCSIHGESLYLTNVEGGWPFFGDIYFG